MRGLRGDWVDIFCLKYYVTNFYVFKMFNDVFNNLQDFTLKLMVNGLSTIPKSLVKDRLTVNQRKMIYVFDKRGIAMSIFSCSEFMDAYNTSLRLVLGACVNFGCLRIARIFLATALSLISSKCRQVRKRRFNYIGALQYFYVCVGHNNQKE